MSDESDYFTIGESVSDLPIKRKPRKERDFEAELFGHKRTKEVIDAFEQQVGISKKEVAKPDLKYRNILLCPADEDDSETLNELLNDPERYTIIKYSDYWTQRGEPKIFVIYTENLDIKKEREKLKLKKEEEHE